MNSILRSNRFLRRLISRGLDNRIPTNTLGGQSRFMSEISSAKIATDQIKERLLSKLDAQLVEVVDTSGGCGQFFKIKVVAKQFEGKSIVMQHKAVNEALKDDIKRIHGLTLTTMSPSAYEKIIQADGDKNP